MPSESTTALLDQLEALDPQDQQELVDVGAQFGTEDVLLQIARFKEAVASVGPIPARYAFTLEDAEEITPLAEAIAEVSGVRVTKAVVRTTSADEFREVITRAKLAASGAKTVLTNTELALRRTSTAESRARRSLISATISQFGQVGRSKIKLASQLTTLRATLSDEMLTPVLSSRGGPEAVANIDVALGELTSRPAPGDKIRGNPTDTRKLNLLEGHAVSILRQARAAARQWSRDRRDPTPERAYELELLYAPANADREPKGPVTPDGPLVTP